MCNNFVCDYTHALEVFSDCYKAQEICNKFVNINLATIKLVHECY